MVWVAGLLYEEVLVFLWTIELSCGRDVSHRKYTDQLRTGLQIELCDFRERNHVRLGCGLRNDRYN